MSNKLKVSKCECRQIDCCYKFAPTPKKERKIKFYAGDLAVFDGKEFRPIKLPPWAMEFITL